MKKMLSSKKDFWSLEGSLVSEIKLSDKELREARESFSEIVSFDKKLISKLG